MFDCFSIQSETALIVNDPTFESRIIKIQNQQYQLMTDDEERLTELFKFVPEIEEISSEA